MNNLSIVLALPICITLTACSDNPPDCSATETKDAVLKVVHEKVGFAFEGKIDFKLESIRTTDFNKGTKAYICAADLVMSGQNGSQKLPLNYKVEKTDKSGEFYITVFGM